MSFALCNDLKSEGRAGNAKVSTFEIGAEGFEPGFPTSRSPYLSDHPFPRTADRRVHRVGSEVDFAGPGYGAKFNVHAIE